MKPAKHYYWSDIITRLQEHGICIINQRYHRHWVIDDVGDDWKEKVIFIHDIQLTTYDSV